MVSHIKNPTHFYVQREKDELKINGLVNNISRWVRLEGNEHIPEQLQTGIPVLYLLHPSRG